MQSQLAAAMLEIPVPRNSLWFVVDMVDMVVTRVGVRIEGYMFPPTIVLPAVGKILVLGNGMARLPEQEPRGSMQGTMVKRTTTLLQEFITLNLMIFTTTSKMSTMVSAIHEKIHRNVVEGKVAVEEGLLAVVVAIGDNEDGLVVEQAREEEDNKIQQEVLLMDFSQRIHPDRTTATIVTKSKSRITL
jgi:hypothetical protein